MNIYVGNLAFNVQEDELKDAFSEFGQVTFVKIIKDKFSGQSRGFGFIEMENVKEVRGAGKYRILRDGCTLVLQECSASARRYSRSQESLLL